GQEELGQPIQIDELTYTYDGNRLLKVADDTNNPDGFKDGTNTGNDYTYDTMGNMLTDQNKGITNIKYNHLNLPTEVTFNTGKIKYTYDAAGTRMAKKVEPSSGVAVTTDYLGGFQYENNELKFFHQPEGFVQKENNQYIYHFIYKDHLGNNRLTYADLDGDGEVTPGEIIEENNYYPFGLRHKGYNELATENPSGFKYKFGGKELNDELGFEVYDFGARNYDPALGRWMNIDPLAEEMRRFSPYNYAFNNPVFFIDPDGMAPFGFDKNKLEQLEPIVDINETLAYEPEPVGMGLKKPTDPPGGGDDDKIYDNGELEELFIDRRNTMTKVGDAIKNQVWEMAYHIYLWEQSLIPKSSSGIYSPLWGDGDGLSFGISLFGNSLSFSMAGEHYKGWEGTNFYLSYSAGHDGGFWTGLTQNTSLKKLASVSATYDVYSNEGFRGSFDKGVQGQTNDYYGGYGLTGSYSKPYDVSTNSVNPQIGLYKRSAGIGTPSISLGASRTRTVNINRLCN